MGERMTIGREEVLHVAKLAELAVSETELDRLVEQLNRIVDYVAQLDEVRSDSVRDAFLPGPPPRAAGKRGGRPHAAGPTAGCPGARVRRRVLRCSSSWRHGGHVSPATEKESVRASEIAREAGKRLRAAQSLNATLDWSQELLDAEASRVDGMQTRT